MTNTPGKETEMEEWQREARALEEMQLSDLDLPIGIRRNKRIRRIISSSEEENCLITESNAASKSGGREVSGKMKRHIKEAVIMADEIEERLDRQSGSPFSKAEAVIQLRTEAKIKDEKIRIMEEENNRLKKEQKKREATIQNQGEKMVAAPSQGKQVLPVGGKETPALEKRLEDARAGDKERNMMAMLREVNKSIEALQRNQVELWNAITGTSRSSQRGTDVIGKTMEGGKGSAPTTGTLRAPAPRIPTAGAVAPPQDGFIEVVGKKKRRLQTESAVGQERTATPGERVRKVGENSKGERSATGGGTGNRKKKKKKKKKNRSGGTRETAAISLVCNEAVSYRDAIAKARESISLKEIGVDTITMRRGLTGAFIFNVKGKEAAVKADRVAEALRKTVPEAKVTRPQRMGSFRLVGIDPSLNARVPGVSVGGVNRGEDTEMDVELSTPIRVASVTVLQGKDCEMDRCEEPAIGVGYLLIQRMRECGAGIAVIAEPWWVPPRDEKWFSFLRGAPLSAVLVGESGRPCSLVLRGSFFVAVKWGDSLVISVYFPPSEVISEFCRLLDELEELLGRFPTYPMLVAGIFNARAC
ncbi:hypothetical protein M0804_013178 [Polistes exclamans]|nr:hypothetical protein M0804_013178 [Polistes exclamans]